MVKVRVVPGNEEKEIKVKGKVKVVDVLIKLGLDPQGYIITRKGEILTEEDLVSDDDELEVYRVVSGG